MEHTTPNEQVFNEIKDAAIKIWNTKDNTYGYVTEKLKTINSITNYKDNVMMCYRMFDVINQYTMRTHLSAEALEYIDLNY